MINITKSRMNQFDYHNWIQYFKRNDNRRLKIDFSEEPALTPKTKALIQLSVRAFQKGEGSDGANLLRQAEIFSVKTGEKDYKKAIRWFIKEENFHSAYLRKFMDFHKIRPLKKSRLDDIFRILRKLGGLKCEVTILVTAEIIALTYYDALSKCTDSPVLKKICGQMLYDELPHIVFQSYTLCHFPAGLKDRIFRYAIMTGTAVCVWAAFHKIYLIGGYGFWKYMRENFGYLKQSVHLSQVEYQPI